EAEREGEQTQGDAQLAEGGDVEGKAGEHGNEQHLLHRITLGTAPFLSGPPGDGAADGRLSGTVVAAATFAPDRPDLARCELAIFYPRPRRHHKQSIYVWVPIFLDAPGSGGPAA